MIWDIRPEVFSFSPLPRWYSLLFAMGVVTAHMMVRRLMPRDKLSNEQFDAGFVYVILGMVIGMRLGHCLFYQPEYYLEHFWEIPMIWQGGYASHGGFFGVMVALFLFMRRNPQISFWWLADRAAIGCMNVAGWIRIGNFFNSEMIGHKTDVPWAVIFAQEDKFPRHPTQLYEAIGYFATAGIAWILFKRTKISLSPGKTFALCNILGFGWRFFCEFFKVEQVAFEQDMWLNLGQLLSIPFFIVALYLFFRKVEPVA
ncbi:MAG: prolipoprotein diacylglyceryl transferase [Proteobacteria bacterium]|nr:prolipoprotein diacylglyceryl transferase [Pseudomonadota bacterium]